MPWFLDCIASGHGRLDVLHSFILLVPAASIVTILILVTSKKVYFCRLIHLTMPISETKTFEAPCSFFRFCNVCP